MYSCESWTIKKAERRRIDSFKLTRKRLLKVPWTASKSNKSIVREINPEHSLEGLMLKLKLKHFGHLMVTADSLEKSLMLGKIEGRRRRGCQRIWWMDDITNEMDMNLGKLWEVVRDRKSWHAAGHGVSESDKTGRLNNQQRKQDDSSSCWEKNMSRGQAWRQGSWLERYCSHPGHKRGQLGSGPILSSFAQSCPTLCDPMNRSRPGLLSSTESNQTHVHWVSAAIQSSHPLSSPSPALNLSQHQGLFKWVSTLHQVAEILEFQLQHQSFQWTPRNDLL